MPATLEDSVLAVKVTTAAARLELSRAAVYNLISAGKIRTVKIGGSRRVPVSELHRLAQDGAA